MPEKATESNKQLVKHRGLESMERTPPPAPPSPRSSSQQRCHGNSLFLRINYQGFLYVGVAISLALLAAEPFACVCRKCGGFLLRILSTTRKECTQTFFIITAGFCRAWVPDGGAARWAVVGGAEQYIIRARTGSSPTSCRVLPFPLRNALSFLSFWLLSFFSLLLMAGWLSVLMYIIHPLKIEQDAK